jgi:hypothetical protein
MQHVHLSAGMLANVEACAGETGSEVTQLPITGSSCEEDINSVCTQAAISR